MSSSEDALFDVDLDDEKAVYVYDSSPNDETARALVARGFPVKAARLGSELMAAAKDGRVRGVVVGASADPELRELFMRAFRGRFGGIPVAYVSAHAGDSAHVAAFRAEGAEIVFPWPLPDAGTLLPALKALFREGAGPPAATPDASTVVLAERDLLARKVSALEAAIPQEGSGAIPKTVFEEVVKEAAKKNVENTELRSELTLVRERNAMLEERAKRLAAEIKSLSKELEGLRVEARAKNVDLGATQDAPASALEGLLAGVETYGWGLEQAIQYFEELKLKVGARAPSLDGHLRTLRLVRALLERLRELPTKGDDAR